MRYLLVLFFLLIQQDLKAQTIIPDSVHKRTFTRCTPSRGQMLKPPLYVVFYGKNKTCKSKNSQQFSGLVLPTDIQTINVLKGTEATNKYGHDAEYGVIEVYLRKGKRPDPNRKIQTDTTTRYRR